MRIGLILVTLVLAIASADAQTRSGNKDKSAGEERERTTTILQKPEPGSPAETTERRTYRGAKILLPGSGERRHVSGYVSGVPVTAGWTCNEATGECTCSGYRDCVNLVLSGELDKPAEISLLYVVQADDHSDGTND